MTHVRSALPSRSAVPASLLLLAVLTGCVTHGAPTYAVLEQPAGSEHELPPLEDGALESIGADRASARYAGDDLTVALYVLRTADGPCLLIFDPAVGEHRIGCATSVVIGQEDREYALLPDGEQPPADAVTISDNVFRL